MIYTKWVTSIYSLSLKSWKSSKIQVYTALSCSLTWLCWNCCIFCSRQVYFSTKHCIIKRHCWHASNHMFESRFIIQKDSVRVSVRKKYESTFFLQKRQENKQYSKNSGGCANPFREKYQGKHTKVFIVFMLSLSCFSLSLMLSKKLITREIN